MDNRMFLIAGVLLAVAIGTLAVFFASSNPDGLESSALVIQGQKPLTGDTPPDAEVQEPGGGGFSYTSPMPDYTLGRGPGKTGDTLAIIIGIILSFIIVLGIAKLAILARRQDQ